MSAHPILDELADFINEQFSMTTGRNRRSWLKAAAILKRHVEDLAQKSRKSAEADAGIIEDILRCVTGGKVNFIDCTPKT